jgi:S1-C subfamily serine protease
MIEPSAPRFERWRNVFYRFSKWLRRAAPFASGVIAALLALVFYRALFPTSTQLTTRDVNEAVAQALASATPPPAFSARVYQAVQPSIVLIQTQHEDKKGDEENSLGTGVVITDRGDILTSLHVVADADEIELTFADGTQSNAEITTAVPENDIAVLTASQPPAQLVPAVLGNPYAMRVGDEAYAVGNPFGLYASMSAGVISGFGRSFHPQNTDQKLHDLIQIDAAVNPGNSGGPLLNRSGQVVGIVVGIVNPTEEEVFIGIGFAVPIDIAGSAAGLPQY